MDRALYVGRFQPFHLGHKEVVERLADRHDELVIAIGGPQLSYSTRHPFEIGERIKMIKNSISVDFSSVYIIPVPDIDNNSIWVSRVENYTPEFDLVYSNNDLVQILFEDSNYEVQDINWVKRGELSGTQVRERMINDGDWEELIPVPVSDVIKQSGGIDRIKRVTDR